MSKEDSTPGEDAVKIVEMMIKDFKQYTNSVDTVAAGFEWIDSNFERSSKMLSKGIS